MPSNCMRSRLAGTAHHCSRLVPRCRKSGKAEALFVVPAGRDHSSRTLSGHSNCETALILAAGQYLAERKLRLLVLLCNSEGAGRPWRWPVCRWSGMERST